MTAPVGKPWPRLAWLALLLLLFLALTLPMALSNRATNYIGDESVFHLPAIRQIEARWPKIDLVADSLSAIAPGYHYFLATVGLVTGTDLIVMRLVNLGVSLGLLLVLWRLHAGTRARVAFCALLPLAASNFFAKSAAYIVTDNPALLGMIVTLAALFFVRSAWALPLACLGAGVTVFVRQISIWLIAPLALRIRDEGPPRWRWALLLPPLLVLGALVAAWGGLVPPVWRDTSLQKSSILVPAAGAYTLAVLGLLAPAYYLAVRAEDWRKDFAPRALFAGVGLGLLFALIGPCEPNYPEGRWGGYLWNLAARLPAPGARSLVFVVLAPLGGMALAALSRRLWVVAGPRPALLWLASLAAWFSTGLVNRQVFHRYYEPALLVFLVFWLLLTLRASTESSPRLRLWPLLGLGAAQLLVTLATAHARTFGFYPH